MSIDIKTVTSAACSIERALAPRASQGMQHSPYCTRTHSDRTSSGSERSVVFFMVSEMLKKALHRVIQLQMMFTSHHI